MTAIAPTRRHRPASRRTRRGRAIGLGALAALLLVIMGFLIWAHSPYPADRAATLEVFRSDNVTVTAVDEGILLEPRGGAQASGGESTGLIFVPGARVDSYAYLFQLSGVVEKHGVTVLITEPPLNLAFFDTRGVADLTTAAPAIERWFVGGHSLGGVRACFMAEEAEEAEVDGLILFGSYCANDLSESTLDVLSIAAQNDLLSDLDTLEEAVPLLPDDAEFIVIDGANHAAFGDYGPQSGDGERSITTDAMRKTLTELLGAFLR